MGRFLFVLSSDIVAGLVLWQILERVICTSRDIFNSTAGFIHHFVSFHFAKYSELSHV